MAYNVAVTGWDAMGSATIRELSRRGKRINMSKFCMSTNTSDEHFVIDSIPGGETVLFAAACSGQGSGF